MDDIHVIFTDYPSYGWSFDSPQIPGLVNLFATAPEAQGAVEDALKLNGVKPGAAQIWEHEQKFLNDDAGNEYLVRFGLSPESFDAAGRMIGSISRNEIDPELMPVNRTDDRLIIGVSSEDTLRWVTGQLRDNEAATVVFHAGNDVVYHIPYANGRGLLNGHSLEELGLTLESTVMGAVGAMVTRDAEGLQMHSSPAPDVERHLTSA